MGPTCATIQVSRANTQCYNVWQLRSLKNYLHSSVMISFFLRCNLSAGVKIRNEWNPTRIFDKGRMGKKKMAGRKLNVESI